MIHQANTRKLVFAALIHDKILPKRQDFGDEFVTEDSPSIQYVNDKQCVFQQPNYQNRILNS